MWVKPPFPAPCPGFCSSPSGAFASLCLIGRLDNATRSGTLTFLPFLLAAKGASATATGFALTIIFIGGALDKIFCGALAPRLDILATVAASEIVTAAIILALMHTSLAASFLLLAASGHRIEWHLRRPV